MTKSDLVDKISAIYPYMHARNVEKVVSIIVDQIIRSLIDGDRVELRGFGSFSVRERRENHGRNPKTGEKVLIEEKRVPFFKAGRHLKSMINDSDEIDEDDEVDETDETSEGN
ncbi:MAG: integration host factor subunit beta [Holosporaceae bacterium]|jgi:integration host factor subunit beta|nr:integration host factor subunit beta [Holosporaceae bacterium]